MGSLPRTRPGTLHETDPLHDEKASMRTQPATLSWGALCATALLGLCAGHAHAGPRDTFATTLVAAPPWGEHFFHGVALNDSGAVVAYLQLPDDTYWYTGPDGQGLYYQPPQLGDAAATSLTDINDAGQISGSYQSPTGQHAFITTADGTGFVDLHPAGATMSAVLAVDEQGRVAGEFSTDARPFFLDGPGFRNDSQGDSYQQLGAAGVQVTPSALRNGVVVGYQKMADGHFHAFRTSRTGTKLNDLGTFGGSDSYAFGVNDAGVAVGYATDAAGVRRAFITQPDGSLRQLDTEGLFSSSVAYGIDAQGHVVGSGYLPAVGSIAFVTQKNGGRIFDLNKLTHMPQHRQLGSANAINAKGQILADDESDYGGPYLLTPATAALAELDAR